mgnify:FL=1
MDQKLLDGIVEILEENALNYSVFLKIFWLQHQGALTNEDIICKSLEKNVSFYGINSIEKDEIFHVVLSSLMYRGDVGAGPSKENLNSSKLKLLMENLVLSLNEIISLSVGLYSFDLKGWHPAYPVFWDFSFLFRGSNFSFVFIGSSSDCVV